MSKKLIPGMVRVEEADELREAIAAVKEPQSDAEIIEQLEALNATATPAPWVVAPCKPDCKGASSCTCVRGPDGKPIREDALIAAARNALPRLLELARDGVWWKRKHEEDAGGAMLQYRRAAEQRDELAKQLACEVAVNADYPDVVKERDRYLAALKAEAIAHAQCAVDEFDESVLPHTYDICGITFRVTRDPATGELTAEEVVE